jgi:co-chaperonin GroES (HSP10)
MKSSKELIVVGDRILISVDKEQTRTEFGLYLPPGVKEKEKVRGGYVAKVGPGYPLPDPTTSNDEPWSAGTRSEVKYIPLQARVGDYALYLNSSAIEIEFEGKEYVVVPQSAILVLVRDHLTDFGLDS